MVRRLSAWIAGTSRLRGSLGHPRRMRTLDMPSSRGDPQATGGQGDRMNAAVKRLIRAGNGLAVFLYRRSNGGIGGSVRGGTPVLLLTAPGLHNGPPHTD